MLNRDITRMTNRVFLSTLLVLSLSLNGCAVNYLVEKLDPRQAFSESKNNVLSTGKLSTETVQELRILNLEEAFTEDPEQTLVAMEQNRLAGREAEQALALAEAAFFHADELYDDGKKVDAARYYLMAAAHSYDFLFYSDNKLAHTFVSPFGRYMTELYNASISRIIDIRETEKAPWQLPWEATVGNTVYRFSRDPDQSVQMAPHSFEEYTPAYEIRAKSLKNLYSSRGIGAPLVGKRKNAPDSPQYDKLFPPVVTAPVTILFKFSPPDAVVNDQDSAAATEKKTRNVVVSVLDPFKLDAVNIEGTQYPIEADYSAAFGVLLKDVNPGQFVLDALLNAGNHVDRIKLTFLQPYDPNKIPVVLVHGLYSSPATYIQMLNDLLGVDEIRSKYQFWAYSYPTGLPIIETSTRLRQALRETAQKFDPDGTSKTFNQMVIVGHSMGGIITRSMVIENSDKLWNAFFTVPIEKLDLTDDERKYVAEIGSFKALPFVKRTVYIASPLRGSDVASSSFVTRLTRWLISLPANMISRRQSLLTKNKQYLNPEVNKDDFVNVARSSVDNLRTDSPILKGYISTPISPSVTYNSIIAIEDAKQGPGSNDGLVRYESAHQDGAESEKLIPAGHVCLEHPQTIAEVRRILLSHSKEHAADAATTVSAKK
jgi:triacylglycerol esterase/lipase EstA (alpha/beta hydrolase family)